VRIQKLVLPAGRVRLAADLLLPERPAGLVVFAHGSGSSRHSPRNRQVAQTLNEAGLATLLFDLLTPEEDRLDQQTGRLRFDIDLLSVRLLAGIGWISASDPTKALPIGLFGASTGGAAALVAAARESRSIAAVVSRGGRPDLANADVLRAVRAPTLLIVGQRDEVVLAMNRSAADQMTVDHHLEMVPGATHLFEEPGALDEVSRLATDWFLTHLGAAAQGAAR
jgi:dienelactone hydrolase